MSLRNTGSILKKNQVITIHDAAVFSWPAGYSRSFRSWYKFLLPILGRRSKRVIAISEFSKHDLIRHGIATANNISIILEAAFSIAKADVTILETHGLIKPFLLTVSSMNPNKNFAALVEPIKLLGDVNFDVVISGGSNSRIFGDVAFEARDAIKSIGYVGDAALRALYENAACFIIWSLYEGFGLPPLEAMSAGCPVIVSRAASLPEVCGDAAIYCNPYRPADIADKIRVVMADNKLREDLSAKGFRAFASVYLGTVR